MRLISGNQLLPRFTELVGQARQVDIAIAWAKRCGAVEALAEGAAAGKRIRIALGLSMNGTTPEALEHLSEFVELRIASPRSGIFHPKFYSFKGRNGAICWVGSSNLTAGGFGGNVELVCEGDDDAGEGRRWFEALWDDLDPDPKPAIAAYVEAYAPPVAPPRPQYQGIDQPEVAPLGDQATWGDFVEGLRARDDFCHGYEFPKHWDVLGVTSSYLHTITAGRNVARLKDWVHLTQEECHVLTGHTPDGIDGVWEFLGNFGDFAHYAFCSDGDLRGAIHELIVPVLDIPENEIVPANVAHEVVQAVRENHNFGPGAATRLVTLARPDCLVSVNGASEAGLGIMSGVAATAVGLANNYAELLHWVYQQPWFNTPEPDEPSEKQIWNSRVALLDAFVFGEING